VQKQEINEILEFILQLPPEAQHISAKISRFSMNTDRHKRSDALLKLKNKPGASSTVRHNPREVQTLSRFRRSCVSLSGVCFGIAELF
jgi:hypothetical protein